MIAMLNQKATPRTRIDILCLILALIGIAIGLYLLTASGQMRLDGIRSEVIFRTNDFENYGRHRAEHSLGALHPVYAAAIATNKTLSALVATGAHYLTGNDLLGRIMITAAYLGLFGLALPLLIYSFTQRISVAIVAACCIFAVDGLKEAIYGYSSLPITGNAATSLYLLALAFVTLKRPWAATIVWFVQLCVHPTTAIMWWVPLVAFALWNSDSFVVRRRYGTYFVAIIALIPLVLDFGLVLANEVGFLFGKVHEEAYWAIVRARTLHTVFLGTERAFLLVVYLEMVAALALLGWSKRGDERLNRLNLLVAGFASGIFIGHLLFVETEASIAVAATLPLRFATVMFALILVNLILISLGMRGKSEAARVMAATMLALMLVRTGVNPLHGVVIWALAQCAFDEAISWRAALMWAGLAGTTIVALVLALPTGDLPSWYLNELRHIPGLVKSIGMLSHWSGATPTKVEFAALFGSGAFLVALGIVIFAVFARKRWIALAFICAISIFSLWNTGGALMRKYPPDAFRREIAAIFGVGPKPDDPAAELVAWIKRNIPRGAGILGDPTIQLRRVVVAQVSIDIDLLSMVVYTPSIADAVVSEYKRLYGIDFYKIARQHRRVRDVLDDSAWVRARNIVMSGQSAKYKWIVETITRPPSQAPMLFKNSHFRVYERVDNSPANSGSGAKRPLSLAIG